MSRVNGIKYSPSWFGCLYVLTISISFFFDGLNEFLFINVHHPCFLFLFGNEDAFTFSVSSQELSDKMAMNAAVNTNSTFFIIVCYLSKCFSG